MYKIKGDAVVSRKFSAFGDKQANFYQIVNFVDFTTAEPAHVLNEVYINTVTGTGSTATTETFNQHSLYRSNGTSFYELAPQAGWLVDDSTTNSLYRYNGTTWDLIVNSEDKLWVNTTDNIVTEYDGCYVVQAGHTVNMPAVHETGRSINFVPANGDWDTLGATFATTDAYTFMNGQTGLVAGADVLVVVDDAAATNWVGFIGSGSAVLPNDRLFADNTTVSPTQFGSPTNAEISTFAGVNTDIFVYYTGTDNAIDAPTYVWYIDNSGNVTLIKEPVRTGDLIDTNVGAGGSINASLIERWQTFTTDLGGTLSKLELELDGTIGEIGTVSIYEGVGNGGVVVSTGSTATKSITGQETVTVNLGANITLAPSTQYTIGVVRTTGTNLFAWLVGLDTLPNEVSSVGGAPDHLFTLETIVSATPSTFNGTNGIADSIIGGAVPQAFAATDQLRYLQSDGTWSDPLAFNSLTAGSPATWDADVLGSRVFTLTSSDIILNDIANDVIGASYIWNVIASGADRTVTFGASFLDSNGTAGSTYTVPDGTSTQFLMVSNGTTFSITNKPESAGGDNLFTTNLTNSAARTHTDNFGFTIDGTGTKSLDYSAGNIDNNVTVDSTEATIGASDIGSAEIASVSALSTGDVRFTSLNGKYRFVGVPPLDSDNANGRILVRDTTTGYINELELGRFNILNGTGAPVNGTTTAFSVGQLYIDTTTPGTPVLYHATAKSTDPDAAATGSTWEAFAAAAVDLSVTVSDETGANGTGLTVPTTAPAAPTDIGDMHIEVYDDVTLYFTALATNWTTPSVVETPRDFINFADALLAADDATGSGGTATTAARSDHKHAAQDVSADAFNATVVGTDGLHQTPIAQDLDVTSNTAGQILDATRVVDEDNFASDSNILVPTQQSTLANIDAKTVQVIAAAPIDGTTTATFIGQLFWDNVNKVMYEALTASTAPFTAPTGSTFAVVSFDKRWQFATANQTVLSGESWVLSQNITINIPENPSNGDEIRFAPDNGDWFTLNVTFDNGVGTATILNVDTLPSGADVFYMVYDATTDDWRGFTGGGSGSVNAPIRLDSILSTIAAEDLTDVETWYINANVDGVTIPDPTVPANRSNLDVVFTVFGLVARTVTLPTGFTHIDEAGNVITTIVLPAGTAGTLPSSTVYKVTTSGTNMYWSKLTNNEDTLSSAREYGQASKTTNQAIANMATATDVSFQDHFTSSGVVVSGSDITFMLPADSGVYMVIADIKTTQTTTNSFLNWSIVDSSNSQFAQAEEGNLFIPIANSVQSVYVPATAIIDTAGAAQTFKVRTTSGTAASTCNINPLSKLRFWRID